MRNRKMLSPKDTACRVLYTSPYVFSTHFRDRETRPRTASCMTFNRLANTTRIISEPRYCTARRCRVAKLNVCACRKPFFIRSRKCGVTICRNPDLARRALNLVAPLSSARAGRFRQWDTARSKRNNCSRLTELIIRWIICDKSIINYNCVRYYVRYCDVNNGECAR